MKNWIELNTAKTAVAEIAATKKGESKLAFLNAGNSG
jgi:hypothetical protein